MKKYERRLPLTGVVVLAAGSSSRFGGARPKQFLALQGEPLFMRSLRVFSQLPSVREMVVVGRSSDRRLIEKKIRRLRLAIPLRFVEGGSFRGASVRNGVRALNPDWDVILVHDSARPMVTTALAR